MNIFNAIEILSNSEPSEIVLTLEAEISVLKKKIGKLEFLANCYRGKDEKKNQEASKDKAGKEKPNATNEKSANRLTAAREVVVNHLKATENTPVLVREILKANGFNEISSADVAKSKVFAKHHEGKSLFVKLADYRVGKRDALEKTEKVVNREREKEILRCRKESLETLKAYDCPVSVSDICSIVDCSRELLGLALDGFAAIEDNKVYFLPVGREELDRILSEKGDM